MIVTTYATLGLIIVLLISLFLIKKEFLISSSLLTLSSVLIVMVLTSFVGDGINDISILLLPGIIIFASYLLNRFIFIFFTILSIGMLGIIRILRAMANVEPLGNVTEYIIAASILILTAMGIKILLDNLLTTIDRSQRSEQKYRHIFNNIQDVYFEMDRSGKIIEISPSVKNILSLNRNEIINQSLNQFFILRKHFDRFIAQMTQEKKVTNYEVEIKTRNSVKKIISINAVVSENNLADTSKIVGSIRDITAQNDLKDQLFQSQKLDSIGKLAGGVAHDFNNLLTVINGHCEIALEQKKDYHHNLVAIRSASMKAAGLTRQLLTFSRKQLYQPLVITPNQIIFDLNKMFKRIIGTDIQIQLDLKHTRDARIKADPTQLEQIMFNLIINARDAIHAHESSKKEKLITIATNQIKITPEYVRDHVESYEGTFFELSVSDTGIGIDREVQKHIFEPFFTTKDRGTGLGLSTVYGIVKQSNGFINVYSEKDVGTTFKIYWPVTNETLLKPEVKIDKDTMRGSEHILLVEDDSQVRDFTKKILQSHGYTVTSAENGQQGLETYKRQDATISMLITDVIMPQMDGMELATAIKKLNSGMKILLISGYADDHIIQNDFVAKKMSFLQKPFTTKEFLIKIRSILDNH
jgi:PAS domain S-box-containing protein